MSQPSLMPSDQVFIESLEVAPYSDRRRVRVEIHLTPFQEPPNLLLVARDSGGNLVTELDIISAMNPIMSFTLHLRGERDPAGLYHLTAELFFETRNPPQDRRTVTFTVPGIETQ